MNQALIVFTQFDGVDVEVGTAHFTRRRNALSTTFRYTPQYLAHRGAYPVDPSFGLYAGAHQSTGLPPAFSDCAPDRWGRNLIIKKAQAVSAREGVPLPTMSDVDFLVGVSDLTRQGALRFQSLGGGQFLDPGPTVPKLVELPRLMRAAESVAHDGGDMAAIKELLDAGSASLGGARPKASVRDGDQLFIAKFAHPGDEWDVMAWEKTALELAQRAGIETLVSTLLRVEGRSVLLLERFDRRGARRVPYISAMTLLGAHDGDARDYTELAETVPEHGSRVSKDLRELWRRIAFSVAVHNTDDHLRNHGFLRRTSAGWDLSPVFDVNPNPDASQERVTGIGGARSRGDELSALLAYADVFDLTHRDAKTVLAQVEDATRGWRAVAASHGINRSEISRFEAAFEGARQTMRAATGTRATARSEDATRSQPRVPGGHDGGGQFTSRS
ncbi:MAG: type II toxin-antitoxin system HipA family toxin [Lapillicoccus sp.]